MAIVRFGMAVLAVSLVSACNRGPDPMSVVQSAEEYNCTEAVKEVAGTNKLTLVALARSESGAEAQFVTERDGQVWTCQAANGGIVTGVYEGMPRPAS